MAEKYLRSIKFPGLDDTYLVPQKSSELDLDNVYTKDEVDALAGGARHYGARWDKASHKMERTGDAASITTTITNFAHHGSVNENYSNPFDDIYPWSGCKLCNIDLDLYLALGSGDDITDCVVAWEGDPDFDYAHENGVWKYRPEFWGTSYDGDDGYRYFDITDKALPGYVHYKPFIRGRWRGVSETRTIDGTEKTVLLPKPGMPCKRTAIKNIHGYANNAGMTLDSIFTLDGSILMAIIEAADFNVQNAWGNGVSSLYRESSDLIQAEASESTVVKVLKANASMCVPNAIFDIGTANGGNQVASRYIVSTADDADDDTLLDVTLDEAVTVTTANYWSIHGRINIADEDIGSQSGYIGTNGKADCYYRGEVFWGNLWLYVLGAYHEATTNHVWLAKDTEDADGYDAIDTSAHTDTGIELSSTAGYIKELGFLSYSGKLAVPIFCTAVGGNSTNPVGDYYYVNTAANTILLFGGYARNGPYDGLYARWSYSSANSAWAYGGCPALKTP